MTHDPNTRPNETNAQGTGYFIPAISSLGVRLMTYGQFSNATASSHTRCGIWQAYWIPVFLMLNIRFLNKQNAEDDDKDSVISSFFIFHSFYIRCCVLSTGFSTRIYDMIWYERQCPLILFLILAISRVLIDQIIQPGTCWLLYFRSRASDDSQ